MKILLCAYNSKYSHTNLAVRSIKAAMPKRFRTSIIESTINDPYDIQLEELCQIDADIFSFSCYIWNISLVRMLVSDLKKIKPRAIVVLGGPEVSFDIPSVFKNCPDADYIVCGEGEESLPELIEAIEGACSLPEGVASRSRQNARYRIIKELDSLPFPYRDEVPAAGRTVYYESSRGCPFSCSYCMSSVTKGVRTLPVDRVVNEISYLVSSGARLIKFVDRTFNFDKGRSLELFNRLSRLDGDFTLHFEICADLLDDELINFLATVPAGRFQFEAGIQSTNSETLSAIGRSMNNEKALRNLSKLKRAGNIHIHADLIAGLPFEGYNRLANSFNEVYPVCNKLQLGFLKLLPGSPLRKRAYEFGYSWRDSPPYEVLESNRLRFSEIVRIREVERALEIYSNSGHFTRSLSFAIERAASPFALFEGLSQFVKENGGFWPPSAPPRRFELFLGYYRYAKLPDEKLFTEYLRLDYLSRFRGEAPSFLLPADEEGFGKAVKGFLKDGERCKKALPYLNEGELKQLHRYCVAHLFYLPQRKVLLIDHKNNRVTDITDFI